MNHKLKVAILGAGGFIGSRLTEWIILNRKAEVVPIVRTFRSLSRIARFNLDFRICDATSQKALTASIYDCDVLFHCVVGNRYTILKSIKAAYLACKTQKVKRLVYLSSCVVYGPCINRKIDEESSFVHKQPFSYNESKVMAENLLQKLKKDGSVEVVIIRPYIVYGPRSKFWTAQIAEDLIKGKAYLVNKGSGFTNGVYIDNLVHALWLSATVNQAANQDFIITDGEKTTWKDLYAAIANALGIKLSKVIDVDISAIKDYSKPFNNINLLMIIMKLFNKLTKIDAYSAIENYSKLLGSDNFLGKIFHSLRKSQSPYDPEIILLQQGSFILPIKKAQKILGYNPHISFAEASRRTAEWLKFYYEGFDYHTYS